MDEAQWLASTDPAAMLMLGTETPCHVPTGRASLVRVSDRKLRLFACACCRDVWRRLSRGASRKAVLVAERHADGVADDDELEAAFTASFQALQAPLPINAFAAAAHACTYNDRADVLARVPAQIAAGFHRQARRQSALQRQAALLREIAGNPFRPVAWEWCWVTARETEAGEKHEPSKWWRPRWVTHGPSWEDALGIATRAYAEHDWAALPILADALEEAGCEDQAILQHLRGKERCPACWTLRDVNAQLAAAAAAVRAAGRSRVHHVGSGECSECEDGWIDLRGPHVRGCWATDCVLGKE